MSLYQELRRRNVIRVAIAYLALAWLVIEVASVLFPSFDIPNWAFRFLVIVVALGFVPTVVFSWAFEITPDGLKREKDVVREASITHETAKRLDLITIGLVAVAIGFILTDRFWLNSRPVGSSTVLEELVSEPLQAPEPVSQYPPNSIAVLPFVNMSSDAEQQYFSDGISEELLNLLAKIPELRVIARTSSFAYRDKDVKIADIARELKVANVLEGSVRKSGDQVRITAQLIRSVDSTHLWSETYDRTLDDIFAVQDEIATAVVGELMIKLFEGVTPRTTVTNSKSYALFLQGRHLNDLFTKESYEEAEFLLKEALAIDPGYAPAWRQLGLTYIGQVDFGRPVTEARKLAQDAYERALALDPNYTPVYADLSLLARRDFNYALADKYLQDTLRLQDDSGFPYGAAASLSRTLGRLDKSIEMAEQSIAYNPVSSAAYSNLGYSCYYARKLDQAAAAFRKSLSLNPKRFRAHVYLGRVLLEQGSPLEALEVIQKASDRPYRLSGLAMAHHILGDNEASNTALKELSEQWSETMAFQIAEVHAFRGNNDAAFEWLNQALENKDGGLNVLLGNPVFDDLTSDDRYLYLVEKLGLLPYWQEMSLSHQKG